MDWLNSMATYGQDDTNEGHVGEDEEDFYANNSANTSLVAAGDTLPGATNVNGQVNASSNSVDMFNPCGRHPTFDFANFSTINNNKPQSATTPHADAKKVENQLKAEQLRAKLMAQRQNTPLKQQSRANTPSKSSSVAPVPQSAPQQKSKQIEAKEQQQPPEDVYGIADLLAEGKAAADKAAAARKMQQQPAKMQESSQPPKIDVPTKIVEPVQTQQQDMPPPNKTQPRTAVSAAESRTAPAGPRPTRPNKVTDAYYADLPIWLEITGYHDVEFRTSKLRTFKERQSLEAEAARIQERLDKLHDDEQATITSIRTARAHSTAPVQRPALPDVIPAPNATKQAQNTNHALVNGNKRAHSPDPTQTSKLRREDSTNGFRIRGANGSPDDRASTARGRLRSRSPASVGGPLERRTSYPDARRCSVDDRNSRTAPPRADARDLSLERRQTYYKRESDATAFDGFERDRHAPRTGRFSPRGGYQGRARLSYGGNIPRDDAPGNYQHYRGSANLDLRRGGIGGGGAAAAGTLWATQEKNQRLLTEAYETSRHVILLFSVNKSMAFQGYALMTSPPDPSLPKPPFCAKLNWPTSPAFKLRWLATTSVHFKYIGHLKNTLNADEDNQPMAVFIGKDGQEISTDAGMGVVEILDDAEQAAGHGGF